MAAGGFGKVGLVVSRTVMVKELLLQPGAAQEPEVFAFASDVEADQQMEIERMRVMLFSK